MRNKNYLMLKQLEQKLSAYYEASIVEVPPQGWINTIRTSLNITLAQLGDKLNITKQGVKAIEISEAKGSITINSLKEVGEVLDLKFVYGFVPKDGSIDNLIDRKAKNLAAKIVMRTDHNMKLENQALSNDKINEAIKELTEELKRDMNRSIWD